MTILYLRETDAVEPMPNIKQSTTSILQWISDSASAIQPKDMKTAAGASKTSLSGTFTESGSPHYAWVKAFISPKLQGDQTIAGTLTIILDAIESSGNKNAFPRIYVYVWKGDDTGIRGVLYSNGNSGTEEGTAEADTTYFSAVALSSVNALDGDRIVIEFMEYHNNTKTASYTDTTYFNAASAPGVSRADFSQTLTFYAEVTYVNVSDSNTSTVETITMQAQLSIAESGNGVDTSSLEAQLPISESGVGTDALAAVEAQLSISDSGVGSDVLASITLPLTDVGAGAEYTIIDEWTEGDEAVTIQGQIPSTDLGEGLDSPSLEAQLSASDLGNGVDILSLEAQLPLSDGGSGVDSVPSIGISITDTGAGADAPSLQAQLPISDAGAGSDSPDMQAQLSLSDSGVGSENVWAGVFWDISDSGVGSDMVAQLQASIPTQDNGQGVDTPQLKGEIESYDGGGGFDYVDARAFPVVGDGGAGVDTPQLQASLPITDSGIGVEVWTKQEVALWTSIIRSALSMLERDMKMEQKEIGMSFEGLERKMKIELMEE